MTTQLINALGQSGVKAKEFGYEGSRMISQRSTRK